VLKLSVPKTVRIATRTPSSVNGTRLIFGMILLLQGFPVGFRFEGTPFDDDAIGPGSNSAQFLLLTQSGQCGI